MDHQTFEGSPVKSVAPLANSDKPLLKKYTEHNLPKQKQEKVRIVTNVTQDVTVQQKTLMSSPKKSNPTANLEKSNSAKTCKQNIQPKLKKQTDKLPINKSKTALTKQPDNVPVEPKIAQPQVANQSSPVQTKVAPPPSVITRVCDTIIKPQNDTRHYRGLELSNQLRVLLVSDPTTDKSAGSLTVKVGSLSDPFEVQGMAHMLEHSLFITSKKYPEEDFFKKFVVLHGGSTNAYTSLTDTVYFFDVSTDALAEAIDRFAQIFIDPVFPEDKIEREIQSVQFEFEDTLSNDANRVARVRKLCGDPKHCFNKFEIGNKDTLKFDKKLLIDFYLKNYSANNMAFVVLGKESLEELEKMVVPLFSQVINRNVVDLHCETHPYAPQFSRKMIKVLPFKDIRKMIIFFSLDDNKILKSRTDALSYLTFLLGHESSGSLLSQLKKLGYCTSIDVSSYYYSGFGFFDVEVDLTQGINANNQIIQLLMQYINMLKSKPPEKEIYEEIKKMKNFKFQYRDKFNPIYYARFLSLQLSYFWMEKSVCGSSLMGEFNEQAITEAIQCLSLENLNIIVVSPVYQELYKNFTVDSIYNIKYVVEAIPESLLDVWKKAGLSKEMHLPAPNRFIPNDFSLKPPQPNPTDLPEMVYNTELVRIWHLQDHIYSTPKVFYGFFFKSHLAYSSPRNLNALAIFVRLFLDHINEKFYSASLVGISFNFGSNKFGLEYTILGFNDKLSDFVTTMIKELLNFSVDPSRYEIFRDIYINELKAFKSRSVTNMLHFYVEQIVTQNMWTADELLMASNDISIDIMFVLLKNILTHCQIEALVHGNILKEEAISTCQNVYNLISNAFKMYPLSTSILLDMNRDIQLNSGHRYEYTVRNDVQENHGLMIYYQIGLEDFNLRARLELFHQLISQPFFNQIRLAEQLAYMTFVQLKYSMSGTLGLCFTIQSAYSIHYLEERIDEFINSVEEIIQKMPPDVFEKEKSSIITKLNEMPKMMFSYSYRLWNEITSGQYTFLRNKKLVAHMKSFKKDAIISFYKGNITSKYKKLVIGIQSSKCKEATKAGSNNKPKATETEDKSKKEKRVVITDIRKFKCENILNRLSKMLTDHL